MDDKDPTSSEEQKPQPGSRLRRILRASQEEPESTPERPDIPPPGTELPVDDSPSGEKPPETTGGDASETPTPPRGLPVADRHPTRHPD